MNSGFGIKGVSLLLSAFPKRSSLACAAKILCCLLLLGGSVTSALSQDSLLTAMPLRSGAPLAKKAGSTIGFKGFYRFLGYVRAQDETFPNNSGKTTAILVGDAYREPMLLLNMMGRTQEGIGFGADLMINSVYKGSSDAFTQPLTLNLGLNLRHVLLDLPSLSSIQNLGVLDFLLPHEVLLVYSLQTASRHCL